MGNKNTDIEVDSTPHDVNDTGYNEEPAKYMANPLVGFINTIKKIIGGAK